MSAVKIIVVGDVNGNFRTLFSKIEEFNKTKGPFEALYCVGNFFGLDSEEYEDLKSGKIEVPISTYILNGNQTSFKELYEPLEKAVPKIVYLGKMGRLVTSSGLKIAYLSGVHLPSDLHDDETAVAETFNKYNIYISKALIKSLENSIGSGLDILLTSAWPSGVTDYAISLDNDDAAKVKDSCSCFISFLAKHVKPRYHFSGLSGLYYERFPYRNHIQLNEPPLPVTRFIGLAPVKKGKIKSKEKWLYGVNITPQTLTQPQTSQELGGFTTNSPYMNIADDMDPEENFFYSKSAGPGSSKKRSAKNDYENNRKKPAIDAACWFCFSNINVEKQLIVTIGNHCYITLAKGVLVPEHVFIVPIGHVASSVDLSPEAFDEVEKFKLSLVNYFHDKNKDVAFFERHYRSPHLQIQAVPIPKQMQGEIESKLYAHACKYKVIPLPQLMNFKAIKELPEIKHGNFRHYFYFELVVNKKPDGKYLVMIDKTIKDFPLQIGRHILADALHVQDRINWQECVDEVEEKKMAERMRKSFQRFDFTEQ